jgi:gamma-glutamyl hercynylcysteine S-oxide synthase
MAARQSSSADLASALRQSRDDTLATFSTYEQALGELKVPYRDTLNPPVWELGHIGWFQEYWIARNPQRDHGVGADPNAPRTSGVRPDADGLYDSSHVPHATRWTLSLPGAEATRADLAEQLDGTLALLRQAGDSDDELYFFRLALFHEDMHHEAALYMAQSLGIAIADMRWQPLALAETCQQLVLEPATWVRGSNAGGFAFDNELSPHAVQLTRCEIDSRVLCWGEFLPFVVLGGYGQAEWWSAAGLEWLATTKAATPRYVKSLQGTWMQFVQGRWEILDPAMPACHLTFHEAEAWCRWAGRRLPTEVEWERAACEQPEAFGWGQVWEWTSSTFGPYSGFCAHPYRDYSAPWFGSRPVLRGASFMTQPRMRHPRYRNFFMAHRNDVAAGFRTCAL